MWVSEDDEHIHLYTAIVWHKRPRRQLRVVARVNRKDPARPRYLILASTDLELGGRKLVEFYGARFQIEFLLLRQQAVHRTDSLSGAK
jgi:hypothetical protein